MQMIQDTVTDEALYRRLQQHLDGQAVGFPATRKGAEIRFLRRMFTPEEARLALHLSYRPSSLDDIVASAAGEYDAERARELLDSMLQKGSIGYRLRDGKDHWFSMSMVIGMFEAQDGRPDPEFLQDAGAYMSTKKYGISLLETRPSQMRTIPIGASIDTEHTVATYDQVRSLLEQSEGPFVILPCICRETSRMRGSTCELTEREETCLGMASMARAILRRGHGREISREEALEILQQNVEEGMVLQPANAQKPEFICSCCGCCCGMLRMQKMLPHPVDFWTTDFTVSVDTDSCTGCGICVKRCQVDAVKMKGSPPKAVIAATRCIGCGLCVPKCPAEALRLVKRDDTQAPPVDEDDLNEAIRSNRRGPMGRFLMLLKVMLRMRQ
jgi:ferredoxin